MYGDSFLNEEDKDKRIDGRIVYLICSFVGIPGGSIHALRDSANPGSIYIGGGESNLVSI